MRFSLFRRAFSSDLNFSSSKAFEKGYTRKTDTVSIDKTGLMQFGSTWPTDEDIKEIEKKKEKKTPLVDYLRRLIQVRGPISVHDYMSQVTIEFHSSAEQTALDRHYTILIMVIINIVQKKLE
jgi:hypothetical protein